MIELSTIKNWSRLAYGEDAEMPVEFIEKLYDLKGPQHDGEWEVKTKDGSTRLWDFNTGPIGRLPDGRKAVISMAVDVTERKQIERDLETHRHHLSELVEERTAQLQETQQRVELVDSALRENEQMLRQAVTSH